MVTACSITRLPEGIFVNNLGKYLTLSDFGRLMLTCKSIFPTTTILSFLLRRAKELKLGSPYCFTERGVNVRDILAFYQRNIAVIKGLRNYENLSQDEFAAWNMVAKQECTILWSRYGFRGEVNLLKGTFAPRLPREDLNTIELSKYVKEDIDSNENISARPLAIKLRIAARDGNLASLQALINHPKIQEIDRDILGRVFGDAARGGHENCVEYLLNCSIFSVISARHKLDALCGALSKNHVNCAKSIASLDSKILLNGGSQTEVFIFYAAIESGNKDCLQIALNLIQASKISQAIFDTTFCDYTANGNEKSLCLLLTFPQIASINLCELARSLVYAIKGNHLSCLKLIIGSPRFAELPLKDLRDCIVSSAEHGNLDALRLLIDQARFKEVNAEYPQIFSAAHQAAAEHNELSCINFLMEKQGCDV